MNTIAFFSLALFCLVATSSAMIPSSGTTTAAATRSGLKDSAFRIILNNGIPVDTPDFSVRISDLSRFPALAGIDVQSTIVRVNLKAGKPFIRHLHPRATETLNALRGKFRVSFKFEGLGEARTVTNVIRAGESTVFPEGLVHETTCISKTDCTFLSVLNSADPGTIPV